MKLCLAFVSVALFAGCAAAPAPVAEAPRFERAAAEGSFAPAERVEISFMESDAAPAIEEAPPAMALEAAPPSEPRRRPLLVSGSAVQNDRDVASARAGRRR